ncbi:MAG: GNAT family N-acetyltransferase [Planctomycetales bacterium]|nr:GNAT family N-acetyltransferase [Planctomycetales bacterium]MCA9181722.1 GNAT family N-acetyltransferase [Planctomycetales bacterium]
MAVTYIKRYRMELRLDRLPAELRQSQPQPAGFEVLPWTPRLLNQHAEVKWASFRDEIDVHVFPCLGDRDGCRRLMREISSRNDFVPEATWLASRISPPDLSLRPKSSPTAIGTIQGLKVSAREGAIQNLGVHPDFRDVGVGRALLAAALNGFAEVDCRYVHLEVTVQNTAAIRLYERFGFHRVETLYKISEVQFA